MENTTQTIQPPQNKSLLDTFVSKEKIKVALIFAALLVILQVPLLAIMDLTETREERYRTVTNEIASKWGPAVTVGIPEDTKAEKFEVSAVVTPEIRYRGIYQAVIYRATAKIKATFTEPGINPAFRLTSISDQDDFSASVNGKPAKIAVVTDKSGNVLIKIQEAYEKNSVVELDIAMCGSKSLMFELAGKQNVISVSGKWGAPSFSGDILPTERKVGSDEFSGLWKVNRPVGKDKFVGVDFKIASGSYQKVTRCLNYSTLFILIFFFTLIVGEIAAKVQLHPVQYIVSSAAPVLFYLMLLALSEHISFLVAYVICSVVVVLMIAMYARMFFGRNKPALILAACFAISYVCNYMLLQLEDFALLIGTAVLTVILGTVMVMTGKLNKKQ